MFEHESDLNKLKYHPRHGTLCRRLLKFIEDSTLISKQYPNVYAKENYEQASEELNKSTEELEETVKNLISYADEVENEEKELNFLKSRLKCIQTTQELQASSIEILQEIIDRPTLTFEQLSERFESTDHLSSTALASMYSSTNLITPRWEREPQLSRRHITLLDDELETTRASINDIHETLKKLLSAIDEPMEKYMKQELSIKQTPVEKLEAIKVPPVIELFVEVFPGAKDIKDNNTRLSEKARKLDDVVSEMQHRFNEKRQQVINIHKRELAKITNAIKCMNEIDNILQGRGVISSDNNFLNPHYA